MYQPICSMLHLKTAWNCMLLLLQSKSFKGTFQDPNKFVQLPLQSAVHREIARYQLKQVCRTTGVHIKQVVVDAQILVHTCRAIGGARVAYKF